MTEKHIHDCTGPEMTCACGYSTDTRRKAADIIEDIVSCADECDGGGSDVEDYAKELYAVAFAAGQRSIQAGEAIPVSPTPADQFEHVKTLPKDWDTYGAEPIDPAVVDRAQEFWRRVNVVPGPDGSVQLEWRTHGLDLDIVFNPDGTSEAYLGPQPVSPTPDLRALVLKWRAEFQQLYHVHATMGTGYRVCADELEALLPASPSAVLSSKEEQ